MTLGLIALAVGGVGEVLLFTRPRWLGAGLLACAAAAAALAWSGIGETSLPVSEADERGADEGTKSQEERDARPSSFFLRPSPALRLVGIAGALATSLGGMLAWAGDPGAVFGWQGVLWVASMVLLVVSCVGWRAGVDTAEQIGPAWTRAEPAALTGIRGLALVTHLVWLNDVPWRFHYDEVIAHLEAMRFYQGPAISVFTTTWYGTGVPSMPFVFTGSLMHLVGTGLAGTRFGVALVSGLMVQPLYALSRLVFGRMVAVIAALGWATTTVVIHYSHVSILDILGGLGYLCCFYFLLRGVASRRVIDFALSGLAAGLSMYIFFNTRAAGPLSLLPVGFVVGFGPLLAYFVRNPGMWSDRGLAEISLHPLFPTTLAGWLSNAQIIGHLAWTDFLGLSVIPSGGNVYWAPFLLPPEAVLLVVGVGALAYRWKEPDAFLVVLWGASVMFVGGILVAGNRAPAFEVWTAAFPVSS